MMQAAQYGAPERDPRSNDTDAVAGPLCSQADQGYRGLGSYEVARYFSDKPIPSV